ncbi:hypothetical protein CEXT_156331 [Caerostris extrusa]|uniref:Uncharacterized protein n=1 Tax=Caerostris extrusa TaxID=172846 RepID=A0AAV4UVP6_CAEEX|nr:hypothetical protein CEXT_156331 [Caerostris extrusa]
MFPQYLSIYQRVALPSRMRLRNSRNISRQQRRRIIGTIAARGVSSASCHYLGHPVRIVRKMLYLLDDCQLTMIWLWTVSGD